MRRILMMAVAAAAGVAGAGENRIFMKQSEEPFTPPYNVANQDYWTGGKMPEVGSGDYGLVQSRLCTLENPAIIDSDLALDQLDVGFSNNTNTSAHVPVLEIRDGTISLPHNLFVGHGLHSVGLVRLTGGLLTDSILAVGREGKGVVTNAGGRIVGKVGSVDSLKIATNNTGDGEYVQTGGELTGRGCYIGRNGKGRFDFRGGTVSFGTLINVGGTADTSQNGTGVFNIAADNGGALLASTLNVGLPKSKGEVDVRANAVFNYVKAGLGFASDPTHPLSEIRIHEGATLMINKRIDLGASSIVDPATFYKGAPIEGTNTIYNVNDGRANLTFLGGTLDTSDAPDGDNIKIGLGSQLCRLQGWGGIGLNENNKPKILYKNTQFIADGGGAERTLDLGMVTFAVAQARNGADGTNGWYAVNKGKLVYPRTYRGTAAYTLGIGDDREISEADLDVVNSLRVTGRWATGAHVVKAALYAEGRSDIPAGLDASADVLGVWEIWSQETYNNATRVNMTDNTVTIRYDHQKLKPRWSPAVYRNTGGNTGWQRVTDAAFDLAARRVKLTDETIGTGTWYAVVANPPGLTIVVR